MLMNLKLNLPSDSQIFSWLHLDLDCKDQVSADCNQITMSELIECLASDDMCNQEVVIKGQGILDK